MRAMRLVPVALAAAVVACGVEARAEEAAAEPPATIQGLAESAVGQVGRLVAERPQTNPDLVLVLCSRVPQGSSAGLGLGSLVRQLLASQLGRLPLGRIQAVDGMGAEPWSTEAGARRDAAAQGYELLLWLQLEIVDNHLVLQGSLVDTERHLWREAPSPEGQVLGQVFVRRRVNAEIRYYLGPIQPGAKGVSIRSVELGRPGYLDLAVADLDGDDRSEVALLRRGALEVARLERDVVTVDARLRLDSLAPAPTRARDPVGTVVVGPRREDGARPIALRTSDHDRGLVALFDGSTLTPQGEVTDYPVRWGRDGLECAAVRPGRNAFETVPAMCQSVESAGAVSPYQGIDEEQIVRPRGPPGVASATALADGRVLLRWNDRPAATIRPFGTAVAVTDLDDDGVAEVLLSSDRDPGEGDELTIVSLAPEAGELGRRVLGAVAGSVWVAAAGDVDDDGLRELLAISESATSAQLLVLE